jgi:hypothetical protein
MPRRNLTLADKPALLDQIKNQPPNTSISGSLSKLDQQGARVSGPMLKSKSEELAKKLGRNDFKAKDG